jgi:hypothetical protein
MHRFVRGDYCPDCQALTIPSRGQIAIALEYPMPRYTLRTLLILLAIGPPIVAVGYQKWERYRHFEELKRAVAGAGRDVITELPPGARWAKPKAP